MNALALLALLFFASKSKSSSSGPPGARRRVTGKSGHTWFVASGTQHFGVDRTDLQTFSVFATESGPELVIAYAQFQEAIVRFRDGVKEKDKDVRVLFYAAPSTVTMAAVDDFVPGTDDMVSLPPPRS